MIEGGAMSSLVLTRGAGDPPVSFASVSQPLQLEPLCKGPFFPCFSSNLEGDREFQLCATAAKVKNKDLIFVWLLAAWVCLLRWRSLRSSLRLLLTKWTLSRDQNGFKM